jgi:membrane protein required for colicin V production
VPYLMPTGLGETPRYALAFVVVFVIALITWSLVTIMVKQAVSSVGLGGIDRLLGGVFGIVRGLVILISLTVLISATPADQSETWQNSTAVKMTKAAAHSLKPLLPTSISALVP